MGAKKVEHSVFDGTTGRSDHSGRRTHIIQILRDTREPLSVNDIAQKVGIHVSTARFHLESLVDAGLATRQSQGRDTPGRPWVGYIGTLPNQTHERAQGYRLLAEILTTAIADAHTDGGPWLYEVGKKWGRFLTTSHAPYEPINESEIAGQLVDKLDALWFAPELIPGDTPELVLHNCPFYDAAERFPAVVCRLHAGMINGSLEEMCSSLRLTELCPHCTSHLCRGKLTKITDAQSEVPVRITVPSQPSAAD